MMEGKREAFDRPDEDAGVVKRQRHAVCSRLIQQRLVISSVLEKTLGPSPYWGILLELYLADLESRPVYQSWLAPGAPPANAHRQSARLAKLGAVIREADAEDNRRMKVRLSVETRAKLDEIMDRIVAGAAPPGS
jgi:hypothetical protein